MDTLTLSQADTRRLEKLAHEAGRAPNGHGKDAAPDDETRHARFPLPNPLDETTSHSTKLPNTAAKSLVIPQTGEGANESLRDAHINDVLKHVLRDGFDATEHAIRAVKARMQSVERVPHEDAMQQLGNLTERHARNEKQAA